MTTEYMGTVIVRLPRRRFNDERNAHPQRFVKGYSHQGCPGSKMRLRWGSGLFSCNSCGFTVVIREDTFLQALRRMLLSDEATPCPDFEYHFFQLIPIREERSH